MSADREDPPPRRRIRLENLAAGSREISGEAVHYLRTVLRLGVGDEVGCFDQGQEATATIREISKRTVRLEVGEPVPLPPPACRLTMALPPPKGERADWVVEKLTEIGVAEILWVECERGVVSPRPAGSRTQRWHRLAEAAARQCGRADLPHLAGSIPFDDLLVFDAERHLIATRDGASLRRVLRGTKAPASVVFLLGPEGGFSGREMEKARNAGYTDTRLGSWTLRVETAAVVAAGMVLGA